MVRSCKREVLICLVRAAIWRECGENPSYRKISCMVDQRMRGSCEGFTCWKFNRTLVLKTPINSYNCRAFCTCTFSVAVSQLFARIRPCQTGEFTGPAKNSCATTSTHNNEFCVDTSPRYHAAVTDSRDAQGGHMTQTLMGDVPAKHQLKNDTSITCLHL